MMLVTPLALLIIVVGAVKLLLHRHTRQWTADCHPSYVRSITGVAFPGGVAVDSFGYAYVSDTHDNRIVKFDSKGNALVDWGKGGKEPGSFDYPQGLAVAEDLVYVADTHNHRIQVFGDNGAYISAWGQHGKGPGQFEYPYSIAIATNREICVVDTGNDRVEIFSHEGIYIREFGRTGLDEGQFRKPQGIALDAGGNLYVGDGSNNRIQKFTADGLFLGSWQCANHDVATDGRGHVFVVGANRVKVFTEDGKLITQWGSKGKAPGQFDFAARVAVDRTGLKIFVADASNNRVQVFTQ
jgi:DNA-binding beta-propeller fold protein YncE